MSPGPLASAFDRLASLLEGTAPLDAWGAPVTGAVIACFDPPNSPSEAVKRAADLLSPLSWPTRWETLGLLATKGPGLNTMTWLQMLDAGIGSVANPDPRVRAAIYAVHLRHYNKIDLTSVQDIEQLTRVLLQLQPVDQWQILDYIGLAKDHTSAEGLIAALLAEAAAARNNIPPALLASIANIDFGDVNRPGNMWWGYYIGNAAHIQIANYYQQVHPEPVHHTKTNYHSIQAIIAMLKEKYPGPGGFNPEPIEEGFKLGKPDIFDWSAEHVVHPGWVYEIKPARLSQIAVIEVATYTSILAAAGVDAAQGPAGAPGTSGALPAPNGWFMFESVLDGVIGYYYVKASKTDIDKRKRTAEEERKKKEAEALEKTLIAVGVTVLFASTVYVMVSALIGAGFTIALA